MERTAADARRTAGKQPYRNLLVFAAILLLTIVMLGMTLAVLSRR